MDEIEKMTQGWWRPSPGSIYPLLEQLTQEGMIRKREDGRYELTEKAGEELEWSFGPSFRRHPSLEEMLGEISGFVSYIEELKKTDPKTAKAYAEKIKELSRRFSAMAEE